MHADKVSLGNGVGLGGCRQLREVGFNEANIVEARGAGETGSEGDMGRIIVDRRDLPAGVGRCRDEGADAEAAAQFEVAGGVVRLRYVGGDIAEQAGERHARRRLLDIEALDIGDVGNVTAGPRLVHARPSTISLSNKASLASVRRGMARDVGSQVFQPSSGRALSAPGGGRASGGTASRASTGLTAKPT